MKSRSLKLRRESLVELTPADLASVNGGQATLICADLTEWCIPTSDCTGYYPSINAPCTGTD